MRRAAALALLLSCRALAGEHPLPEPPPGPRVDYSADALDFDSDKALLHLKGGVTVKESTWTVKGEDFWIDTSSRTGRSDGPLLVEDGVSALYGDSGTFDFGRHAGRVLRSSTGHGDWRIHARQGSIDETRRIQYRGADFTSCSAHPPHYHFRASSVSVVPNKSLIAYNALFYLGRVPVFYLPFLYKSLSKTHLLRWKTQPGLDRRDGVFLKNTLTTEHSDTFYSKLYLDYYQEQGLGYGGELHRRDGADSRGSLFGYTIQESSGNVRRWAMLGQQYQALPSSMSFQARLQLQSDAEFNNHYSRSSALRVTPELVNGGALVKRFGQATARLSYSRLDQTDPLEPRKFRKTTESVPRLDVQSTPLRFWRLPWLNTLSGFADNVYVRGRPYLEKSAGAGWEGAASRQFARGVSLAPKLSFQETYYNRLDSYGVDGGPKTAYDAVVGRWTLSNTLRFDTPVGGWDLAHAYQRRFKRDSFTDDASALDKGVEQNLLTVSDVFLPAPRVWARVSSGYDFRTFRDHTVGYRGRIQPIVAETSWTPTPRLGFSLRNDYKLDEGERSFIGDARWGDDEGTCVGGGFAYNAAAPGVYAAALDFAVAPSSPTWRLAFGVRADAQTPTGPGRLHGLRVFEKEFSWTRRWHDFYTKLTGRFRPGGVGEYAIRIDFKFGSADPKRAPRRDWESELFPERERQDVLRP